MQANKSTERDPSADGKELPPCAKRGQLLIVEPDPLAQCSLKTCLGKWFGVGATDSTAGAQETLEGQLVDALIIS